MWRGRPRPRAMVLPRSSIDATISTMLPPLACPRIWLCVILLMPMAPQAHPVRLDSSDWWSYTRQEELPNRTRPKWQSRTPAEANFQIAGINLDTMSGFAQIRSRFGEAAEVERGDAASGRQQICYKSPFANVHLIFEFGEVNSAVYLFEDGHEWNGSELCATSPFVSPNTSTESGLKLGITPQQVRAILGTPSTDTPQQLNYYFAWRKKTGPEAMAQFRKENPNMSDAELHRNFDYLDIQAYIEARFESGKMNYLAVCSSETY